MPYHAKLRVGIRIASNLIGGHDEQFKKFIDLSGPLCIVGDFNMVLDLQDRWTSMGQVIQGKERDVWDVLYDKNILVDVLDETGFTWSNKALTTGQRDLIGSIFLVTLLSLTRPFRLMMIPLFSFLTIFLSPLSLNRENVTIRQDGPIWTALCLNLNRSKTKS